MVAIVTKNALMYSMGDPTSSTAMLKRFVDLSKKLCAHDETGHRVITTSAKACIKAKEENLTTEIFVVFLLVPMLELPCRTTLRLVGQEEGSLKRLRGDRDFPGLILWKMSIFFIYFVWLNASQCFAL